MKSFTKVLSGILGAAALVCTCAVAQDEAPVAEVQNAWYKPSISLTLEGASRYMSKGKVCNPRTMFFGDLNVSLECGLYAGAWIAHDSNCYNQGSGISRDPEELDYYFGYFYEIADIPVIKSLAIDASFTYFDYPKRSGWNLTSTEQEVALKLKTGNVWDLGVLGTISAPGFQVAWDYEDDIWWAKVFIGHDRVLSEITDALALSNGFELYWGNTRFNSTDRDSDLYKNALTTFVWTASLDYSLNDYISFGPYLQFAWMLDHDVREDAKASNCNNAFNMLYGFKLAASF